MPNFLLHRFRFEKVNQSRYRPGVAQKAPGFHDNGTGWWYRLYPQEMLLALISVRG